MTYVIHHLYLSFPKRTLYPRSGTDGIFLFCFFQFIFWCKIELEFKINFFVLWNVNSPWIVLWHYYKRVLYEKKFGKVTYKDPSKVQQLSLMQVFVRVAIFSMKWPQWHNWMLHLVQVLKMIIHQCPIDQNQGNVYSALSPSFS